MVNSERESAVNHRYFLIPMLLVLVSLGCAKPYYGYTKAEWDNLTDEERSVIKQDYEFLIEAQNQQKHGDTIDARTQSIIDRGTEGIKK